MTGDHKKSNCRVLIIAAYPPAPYDRSGGALRMRNLINYFNKKTDARILFLNYRDEVACHDDIRNFLTSEFPNKHRFVNLKSTAIGGIFSRINSLFRVPLIYFNGSIPAFFVEGNMNVNSICIDLINKNRIDYVFVSTTKLAFSIGAHRLKGIELIIDADDWEPDVERSRSALRSFVYRASIGRIRYLVAMMFVQRLVKISKRFFLASPADVARLAIGNIRCLPHVAVDASGCEIQPLERSASGSHAVLTVGNWSTPRNSEGLEWFLKRAWPLLLSRNPSLRLKIVGVVPEDLSARIITVPNVECLGFVEDTTPLYRASIAVIAPVTWGGGVKAKVIEAMAFGRVVAGPKHAFAGLGEQESVDRCAIVADSPEVLSQKLHAVIEDDSRRWEMEENGIAFIRKHFSIQAFSSALDFAFSDFGPPANAGPS